MEIFLDNKYTRWYYDIINNAKSRDRNEYCETHHIIPESYFKNRSRKGTKGWLDGDPNDKENLVRLTAREHFICHWLLVKMSSNLSSYKKAVLAINGMKLRGEGQKRYDTKITAKVYEKYRIEAAAYAAAASRGIKRPLSIVEKPTGEKNGMFGQTHTPEVKEMLSLEREKWWADDKNKQSRMGENHPHYDFTIYQWQNKKTNEVIYMTQREMCVTYGIGAGAVNNVIKGRSKSTGGWLLIR